MKVRRTSSRKDQSVRKTACGSFDHLLSLLYRSGAVSETFRLPSSRRSDVTQTTEIETMELTKIYIVIRVLAGGEGQTHSNIFVVRRFPNSCFV